MPMPMSTANKAAEAMQCPAIAASIAAIAPRYLPQVNARVRLAWYTHLYLAAIGAPYTPPIAVVAKYLPLPYLPR